MYAVLDTCTLIPALRSRAGASYAVLQAVRRGRIRIAIEQGEAKALDFLDSR